MKNNNKYNVDLGITEKILIGLSILLVVFSFFAPRLFVKETTFNLDFSQTGHIGDTIGGIMNPFIAISGVLLTFLAFYWKNRSK